ncbi:MAG TPA: hypothetical protein VHR66_24360 [Gemmataceae bacterium]|jgi:hypothetical protein|nr:hypothetical protein [Gemmataceae bacterium]
MNFGKHRNKELKDVPLDYLEWMLFSGKYEFRSISLEAAIREEYDQRINPPKADRPNWGSPPKQAVTPDSVDETFRTLSRKYHPDCGGSNEAQQALSDFRDAMLKRINLYS